MAQRAMLKINDKTASTNAVTFQAIDAQRADKKMYDVVYEMLDENGEYITA